MKDGVRRILGRQADRRGGCGIDEEGRANRVAEWTVEIWLPAIKGFWKRCNSHLGWELARRCDCGKRMDHGRRVTWGCFTRSNECIELVGVL